MLGIKTAALPASLRRTNQRTVISLLFRLGSASRADLAKAAGLSQPTAGKIISELLELGILKEAGLSSAGGNGHGSQAEPRLGRPGQLLRLDDKNARFLAIELGVSETCISALPVSVNLTDEWRFRFRTPNTPEAWVKELRRISGEIPGGPFWGVLVSVPGVVDEDRGKVLFSPNLHWLEKTSLPELAERVWHAPVVLLQEIRALALGHRTAVQGSDDFLLVDFGQGVGGAIVLEGQLYSHPMPLSGEVGHTPVPANDRPCGCGAVGCLETLVSEGGLLESFAAAHSGAAPHGRIGQSSWERLVRHVNERGLEPWLAQTIEATGKIIAGALNVLGIHRVIITGSLTELPGAVLEHLSEEVKKGAMWARFGEVVCEGAPRHRGAGLIAAGIDRLILPAN